MAYPLTQYYGPMNMAPMHPTILSTHSAPILSFESVTSDAHISPSFHSIPHVEILFKNPFLSYDLANLGRISMSEHQMMPSAINNIQHFTSESPERTIIPMQSPPKYLNTLLTPTSSPLFSRPLPSAHSPKSSPLKSNHSSELKNSDEPNDAEKSIMPVLRPNSSQKTTVGGVDSTTINMQTEVTTISHSRCDFKAPSSRKSVHEIALTSPQLSDTRIKVPITTQKTVWRPY